MKIISNFYDYYDCVMKTSFDPDLVYIRNEQEEILEREPCGLLSYFLSPYNLFPFIIGFCGKIYAGYKKYYCLGEATKKMGVDIYFDEESAVKSIPLKDQKQKKFKYILRAIKSFFDIPKRPQIYLKFFRNNCPIFIIENFSKECKLIKNARLKPFEFYRIFDVYQTFQELQMYLGGLARPEKNTNDIPDKYLIEGKGFDTKWSFRKESKKKKNRRKK